MPALLCHRCGAANPARSVLAGASAFGLDVVPLRCCQCGERSSALRGFGGYAGFFVLYGLSFLAVFLGVATLWPRIDPIFPIVVAALVPMLLLPAPFAWLFLRAPVDDGFTPPGDLSARRKVGYLIGGLTIALLIIVGGLTTYVFLSLSSRPPSDPSAAEVVELDAEALAWRCQTLAGEEIALAELGDHVVFFNVWATWCGPCVAEMPSIAALREAVAGDGIRFLLVTEEDPETVASFVAERDLALPFATSPSLPGLLDTTAIPATFVLQNGRILYRHVGAADWNDADFRRWLRDL